MALRAELIGPYCLILVTSSVCAARGTLSWIARFLARLQSARMSLPGLTAAALKCGRRKFARLVKGYRSTINSRIRTGTDSGNPTV